MKKNRGERHQYNYTFVIDTATMETTMTYPDMTMNSLHVSHSFTQFVRCDGNNVIMVDHGDGYPRAVYMKSLPLDDLDDSDAEPLGLSLLDIWGEAGNNSTGVTVDGFELGKDHHIVVGTSIPCGLSNYILKESDKSCKTGTNMVNLC